MSAAVLNRSVLVLNRNWLAIHICNVRRALSLVYADLAKVVDEKFNTHDFESWMDVPAPEEEAVHSPNFSIRAPQVIVLTCYTRRPPQHVRFSRRNLLMRDNHECQYCGCSPRREELTLDHVTPRSRGGKTTWENVVVSCVRCNTKKGNRTPDEAHMPLRAQPRKPSWNHLAQRVGNHGSRPLEVWRNFISGPALDPLLSKA